MGSRDQKPVLTPFSQARRETAIYKYVLPVFTERFAAWIEREVCCSSMISCSDSGGKPFGRKRRNFGSYASLLMRNVVK